MNKRQLLEQAQELGIKTTSKMTKAELEELIANAIAKKEAEAAKSSRKVEKMDLSVFGLDISKRSVAKDKAIPYIDVRENGKRIAEIWPKKGCYSIHTNVELEGCGTAVHHDNWQMKDVYTNLTQEQVEKALEQLTSEKAEEEVA